MRSGWAANRLRVRSSMASNAMTVVVASVRLSADSVSKVRSMAKEHLGPCYTDILARPKLGLVELKWHPFAVLQKQKAHSE
jgi:hypothetical protein